MICWSLSCFWDLMDDLCWNLLLLRVLGDLDVRLRGALIVWYFTSLVFRLMLAMWSVEVIGTAAWPNGLFCSPCVEV